ncbi:MAG: beta-ketoacyl synthase chain length factor [Casimicrobiaceae bacterium]
MRLSAYIEGIGVIGPGFDDWPTTQLVLSGQQPYVAQRTNLPIPTALPPSERRRASRAIKIALGAGFEAIGAAQLDPATLVTVFSSSSGDGYNCHEICQQLSTSDRQISPTRFHNSVHNAPAGYWSIASGAMATSSVLCAHDASFGAGLIEALAQVVADGTRVVLIAYDSDYPEPLHGKRPIPDAFGVGLVFAPAASARSLARIAMACTDEVPTRLADPALEALRKSIPAARSLPMLQAVVTAGAGTTAKVVVDYLFDVNLEIEVGR